MVNGRTEGGKDIKEIGTNELADKLKEIREINRDIIKRLFNGRPVAEIHLNSLKCRITFKDKSYLEISAYDNYNIRAKAFDAARRLSVEVTPYR